MLGSEQEISFDLRSINDFVCQWSSDPLKTIENIFLVSEWVDIYSFMTDSFRLG